MHSYGGKLNLLVFPDTLRKRGGVQPIRVGAMELEPNAVSNSWGHPGDAPRI